MRDLSPLEAVAAAIGYQSASAFSTAFRRESGAHPVTSLSAQLADRQPGRQL